MIFSYDTWCTLSGNVKSDDKGYWCSRNHHGAHLMPVHVHKSRSWFAESMQNWWSTFFWKNKINSDTYVGLFLTSFFGEIKCLVTSNRTLPGHTTDVSVTAPKEVFGEQLITCGLWSSSSQDVNPCGYYLWWLLEYSLYVASLQCESAKGLYSKITSSVKKYFQKLPDLLRNSSAFNTLL